MYFIIPFSMCIYVTDFKWLLMKLFKICDLNLSNLTHNSVLTSHTHVDVESPSMGS